MPGNTREREEKGKAREAEQGGSTVNDDFYGFGLIA
jgi:hypothetical protein